MIKAIGILTVIFLLFAMSSSDNDSCYFKQDGRLNKSLVASAVSKEALKLAKNTDASVKGTFKSIITEDVDSTTVEVIAVLTAQNSFGVFSETSFTIKADLLCDGYNVLSITKNK